MVRQSLEYTEMELAVPSQARKQHDHGLLWVIFSLEGKKEIATSILIVCFKKVLIPFRGIYL
jgi:hypothetical protein